MSSLYRLYSLVLPYIPLYTLVSIPIEIKYDIFVPITCF